MKLLLLTLIICSVSGTPHAHARSKGSRRGGRASRARLSRAERTQFRAHEKLGTTYYRQKKYKEALVSFLRAIAIKKKQGLYFNIAQCYRFTDQPALAHKYYQLFYVALDSIRGISRRKRARYKKEMMKRMAEMKVAADKKAALKAAEEQKRHQALKRAHALKLERERKKRLLEVARQKRLLALERARKAREEAKLRQRLRAQQLELRRIQRARAAQRSLTNKWWFWTGVGATTLFAVSTAVFGTMAISATSDWESTWDPKFRDDVKRYRNIADISLGLSFVTGVGTALYTLYFWTRHPAIPTTSQRVTVLPACTGSGCGLSLTFRF